MQNIVYNIDCMDYMKDMPDKYFDLIIIDPPYNIKKAEWDKFKSDEDYYAFIINFMKECQRISKDNSSTYFFHNDYDKLSELQYRIKRETNYIFKQFITWNKYFERSKNEGFCKQRLSIDMQRNYYNGFSEYLLFYTFQDKTGAEDIKENYLKQLNPFAKYIKDEFKKANINNKEIAKLFPSKNGGLTGCVSNWLNGDNIMSKEQYLKIRHYLNNEYLKQEYEYLKKEYEDYRYYFNVQPVKTDSFKNQNWNNTVWNYDFESSWHPTPKPIRLIKNILLHSARPGGIIFNPFNGSEKIRIACYELGFDFIGCELYENIWKRQENEFEKYKEISLNEIFSTFNETLNTEVKLEDTNLKDLFE